MTELHWLGAAEAAKLIRNKTLSPVELTEALLRRIEQYDARLNAFITLTGDAALARAREAEAAVMAGAALGPLHGVPYGLKDIIDTAKVRTTCHSRLLLDNVPTNDAAVAQSLSQAGGILVGKLATHEFAIGGPAFDLPFPPARNPWNTGLFPGGSSSGSGAAVAAGFLPAALGTDTGGSVRNPASMCGLVGMKATYGRVSRRGVFPLSYSLDHVGPLTRSVADNALLLQIISGHDSGDPGSAPEAAPDFTAALGREITGMRIGVLRHFHERDMQATAAVAGGIERALALLADLGAEIVEIETAPLQDFAACNRIILLAEACAIHRRWLRERPQDYSALTRERLMPGLFITGIEYVEACRWRRQIAEQFDQTLRSVDVAICASSMGAPFPLDDPQAIAYEYPRQARTAFNVTGHPALSLPVGFDGDGLPLALQIVGRYWDEATVYRVAHAYEQATDWHHRHPDLA